MSKKIEVLLPDDLLDVRDFTSNDINLAMDQLDLARGLHRLSEQKDEAWLRKLLAYYLIGTATVVLLVSLALVVLQALGLIDLPDQAVSVLIGSVAVEFVGMLLIVVRYLFDSNNKK